VTKAHEGGVGSKGMKKRGREDKKADELRTRAEKLLKSNKNTVEETSDAAFRTLVNELQVHQVELEMQNEELRRTQLELEASREKYYDLYDLAPVGYFSLDHKNLILEVNLNGASMVGMERRLLVKKRFTQFIVSAFQDPFYMFQKETFKTGAIQTLEVQLKKKNSIPFWVHLDGVATQDTDSNFTHMRIIAIDISEKKQILENLKKSHDELERRVEERTDELMKANAQLESLSGLLISTQEKERRRIAEELHDSVGQNLAALKFNIEYIINLWGEKSQDTCLLLLQRLIPKLQAIVIELSRIGKGLRPSMLDDLGVLAALSWFCREFKSVYSAIHIEKVFDIKEDHIPDNLKVVIYRILQEALNNVSKHSSANRVRISLRKKTHAIEFTVMDNGRGFDVDASLLPENQRNRLGLVSMIKRAELSGGSLVITSDKEKGTVIRASWPST